MNQLPCGYVTVSLRRIRCSSWIKTEVLFLLRSCYSTLSQAYDSKQSKIVEDSSNELQDTRIQEIAAAVCANKAVTLCAVSVSVGALWLTDGPLDLLQSLYVVWITLISLWAFS